jgi:hypothetical protein
MLTELLRGLFEVLRDFFVGPVLLPEQLLEDSSRLRAATCHRGLQLVSAHEATLDRNRLRPQAKYWSGPVVVHFGSA